MKSISQDILRSITDQINIVDLISDYVSLKSTGSNYKGLCPFHQEKTPSFTVSQAKGLYYCFGCGVHGNAINFLQNYLNISFLESVNMLAERCGINIPNLQNKKEDPIEQELRNLYHIAQNYYSFLLKDLVGKEAYKYFIDRKLLPETIEKFGLGYSLDAFDSLLKEFRKRNISNELLVNSGLISQKNGKYYDFFRNRAMFPIKDTLGRTIAFGGRQIVVDKNSGKYINSSESLIYNKKKILFGLYEAMSEIRKTKEVFIVEGYLDVITLSQAGIKNVVAPCGTSLTIEQLKLLEKYTNVKTIYFLFDGDQAGVNATIRSIQIVLNIGFDLRIISLPPNEDPDKLINSENGIEQFYKYKENYFSFVEFIYKKLKENNKLTTAVEKSNAIRDIIKLILSIQDIIQHRFYLENLSEVFNFPIYDLNIIYEEERNNKAGNSNNLLNLNSKLNNVVNIEDSSNNEIELNINDLEVEEKDILKFALKSPNNFRFLKEKFNISENNFITNIGKLIFEIIFEYWDNENIINELYNDNTVSATIIKNIEYLQSDETTISENWKSFVDLEIESEINLEKTMEVIFYKLRIKAIELELKKLLELIKTADTIDNTKILLEKMKILQDERKNITDNYLKYE